MPASPLEITPSAGFPKHARLLTAEDFSRVFAKAKAYRDPHFTLLVRPNTVYGSRLGLVIGKKKVKLAVQRNRIKRLTRESFRQNRSQLPAIDIVLVARQGFASRNNAQITAALTKQWQRIRRDYEPLSNLS